MIKINFKNIAQYFLLSAVFAGLSFLIKHLALLNINSSQPIFNDIFLITYVKNTGAAFSLFPTHTDLLISLAIAIIAIILFYILTNSNKISQLKLIALSSVTAGVLGNLSERIQDGFVTDYICLNFINFPVFNAFDILITIGAILLIVALYQNR